MKETWKILFETLQKSRIAFDGFCKAISEIDKNSNEYNKRTIDKINNGNNK